MLDVILLPQEKSLETSRESTDVEEECRTLPDEVGVDMAVVSKSLLDLDWHRAVAFQRRRYEEEHKRHAPVKWISS